MFIFWNWLTGVLCYLGLYKKSGKLLLLGLDNAGKTTILQMLKDDKMGQYSPTIHPTSEELNIGKVKFIAFDLGGHREARKVWQDYYPVVDAIVFLIDAADRARFEEARQELESVLIDETLSAVPILILANKIDQGNAASEEELQLIFQLNNLRTGKGPMIKSDLRGRPLELFMVSVLKKTGYGEAFRWLSQFID
jgi:GTP-binding protein SAR1